MTCIDSTGTEALAGVTSGGHEECDTSVAAFYTRISEYYDWIQETPKYKLAFWHNIVLKTGQDTKK